MRVETCGKCNKRYSVTEIGGGWPGSKEKEDIRCPYCGQTFTERSNGAFITHKLENDTDSEA